MAFKPKTDDMREAPSIVVIRQLSKEGAKINAFDPEAEENAKKLLKDIDITYFKNPLDAIKGSDCLVIATEWNEFRSIDREKMRALMNLPNIVDGRNIYEPDEMRNIGFNYIGIGR